MINDILVESFPDVVNVGLHRRHGGDARRGRGSEARLGAAMIRDFYGPFKKRSTRSWRRSQSYRGTPRRGDRHRLREVRQAHGQEARPLRLLPRLHGLPRLPEHPLHPPGQVPAARLRRATSSRRRRAKGRGREFYGCTNYPDCDFITYNKPTNSYCPKCGWFLVEKFDKKRGSHKACINPACDYLHSQEDEHVSGRLRRTSPTSAPCGRSRPRTVASYREDLRAVRGVVPAAAAAPLETATPRGRPRLRRRPRRATARRRSSVNRALSAVKGSTATSCASAAPANPAKDVEVLPLARPLPDFLFEERDGRLHRPAPDDGLRRRRATGPCSRPSTARAAASPSSRACTRVRCRPRRRPRPRHRQGLQGADRVPVRPRPSTRSGRGCPPDGHGSGRGATAPRRTSS